ncbi:hepatitis A virus cellular receptor 1-like isoform X1 [Channa argus]|uniref:hepatitis A virus cellular receptor 1-like isoform X1 n=1 Tax=Channa argus TaxID=215402 RepID=UPI00352170CA
MKVTVYSCWFFLVLGSNAAAEIIQKVFEEKQQISLPCPRPVDAKVTWSRETNGHKEDILTAHDRDEKHINDPDKRFSSLGDKSLYISRAAVSDSGTYFCNNKKAVELTVIPSGEKPQPTTSTVSESLKRQGAETLSSPPTVDKTDTVTTQKRHRKHGNNKKSKKPPTPKPTTKPKPSTSTTTTTTSTSTTIATATTTTTTSTSTTIATATTTTTTSTSTIIATATTTSTTSQPNPAAALMVGVTVPFTVLIIIIITIVYFTRRRRCKRRENEEIYHVYDDIQDGPPNAVGPATFSMTPFSGASDQTEPTYSTICEYPPTEIKMATESPYSLISGTVVDGNNKGQTKLNYSTYVLLDKPQTPANNHDHL